MFRLQKVKPLPVYYFMWYSNFEIEGNIRIHSTKIVLSKTQLPLLMFVEKSENDNANILNCTPF
jgi:hypothetical protein